MNRDIASALLVIAALAFTCFPALAAESGTNDAVVTVIQGTASLYTKGATTGHLLKKGDTLTREHEVRVAEKSRIEIRFADGTVMRLSERSHLKMNELTFNKQTTGKNVKVELGLGKLWAKVKKLTTTDSLVEVKTSNAVAGVRGTVYRVNVNDDKSALVKVYDGEVYVANPPRDAAKPDGKVTAPHEVSMEEWTAIVKTMQQISISPQGVPSKPQNFDPKADADDWVKWNQERDKELLF